MVKKPLFLYSYSLIKKIIKITKNSVVNRFFRDHTNL